MRTVVLLLGLLSAIAGVGQVAFVAWAAEASWHLGSPIRLHGKISGFFVDHPHQAAVENLYQTGLRVADTLQDSLGVHLFSGFLLVLVGAVQVGLFFWLGRHANGGQPPNNSFKPTPLRGAA